MYGLIYMIGHFDTRNVYIGQTINFTKRMETYRNRGARAQPKLQHAFNKYGFATMTVEILATSNSKKDLDRLEKLYINRYDSIKFGYNCREGGANGTHSDETRQKLAAAQRGKKHTEATKKRVSEARVGKPKSQATRERMSRAQKGRVVTEATRARISFSKRGKPQSESAKIAHRKGSKSLWRAVVCIETQTTYECIADAARKLDLFPSGISACLNGALKHTGGMSFMYADNLSGDELDTERS